MARKPRESDPCVHCHDTPYGTVCHGCARFRAFSDSDPCKGCGDVNWQWRVTGRTCRSCLNDESPELPPNTAIVAVEGAIQREET